MPPVCGGVGDVDVGLSVALTADAIDVAAVIAHAGADEDSAVACFIGQVRNHSGSERVDRLEYEAYGPMALAIMREIARDARVHHQLTQVTLVHRVGELRVGEVAVVVITSAPHRAEAFDGCRRSSTPSSAMSLSGNVSTPPQARCGRTHAAWKMPVSELSHLGADGHARMVDVGDKPVNARAATAEALVRFHEPTTLQLLRSGTAPKGDVLGTARLAGVMAAKRTAELIPLCHPLPLDVVDVDITVLDALPGVRITVTARCRASTGVEMEALTGASVAALTVIDMLKSADRWISIEGVRLLEKSGGRHGHITRPATR
jgi:cyclic pyranopterin monophosphate synthase